MKTGVENLAPYIRNPYTIIRKSGKTEYPQDAGKAATEIIRYGFFTYRYGLP